MTDAVRAQIRAAYQSLVGPADRVPLTQIRHAIACKDRAAVDRALRELLDDPAVRLEPEPFRWRLGAADREAAVHIGGEDRHHLIIY